MTALCFACWHTVRTLILGWVSVLYDIYAVILFWCSLFVYLFPFLALLRSLDTHFHMHVLGSLLMLFSHLFLQSDLFFETTPKGATKKKIKATSYNIISTKYPVEKQHTHTHTHTHTNTNTPLN